MGWNGERGELSGPGRSVMIFFFSFSLMSKKKKNNPTSKDEMSSCYFLNNRLKQPSNSSLLLSFLVSEHDRFIKSNYELIYYQLINYGGIIFSMAIRHNWFSSPVSSLINTSTQFLQTLTKLTEAPPKKGHFNPLVTKPTLNVSFPLVSMLQTASVHCQQFFRDMASFPELAQRFCRLIVQSTL